MCKPCFIISREDLERSIQAEEAVCEDCKRPSDMLLRANPKGEVGIFVCTSCFIARTHTAFKVPSSFFTGTQVTRRRITNGEAASKVTLRDKQGNQVLTLSAKYAGTWVECPRCRNPNDTEGQYCTACNEALDALEDAITGKE